MRGRLYVLGAALSMLIGCSANKPRELPEWATSFEIPIPAREVVEVEPRELSAREREIQQEFRKYDAWVVDLLDSVKLEETDRSRAHYADALLIPEEGLLGVGPALSMAIIDRMIESEFYAGPSRAEISAYA